MSISVDQYQRLLARTTRLEESMNDAFVAQARMVSLDQVNQLLILVQTDIQALTERIEALEERVQSIEEEPIS